MSDQSKQKREALAARVANGRLGNKIEKQLRQPKELLDSDMSPGEQMIWAAAYADEYRRAIVGVIPHYGRPCVPLQAAEHATLYAFEAVTSARQVLRQLPSPMSAADKRFLCDMLTPEKRG